MWEWQLKLDTKEKINISLVKSPVNGLMVHLMFYILTGEEK